MQVTAARSGDGWSTVAPRSWSPWMRACATFEETVRLWHRATFILSSIPGGDDTTLILEQLTHQAERRLAQALALRVNMDRPPAPVARPAAAPEPGTDARHPDGSSAPPPPARSGPSACPLTRRERQVAVLIAGGLSNRQIADALVLTPGTAANHVANILRKLDCANRVQVAAWAVRSGLLAEDPREPA